MTSAACASMLRSERGVAGEPAVEGLLTEWRAAMAKVPARGRFELIVERDAIRRPAFIRDDGRRERRACECAPR
jgi:hypothetical protein